MQNTSPYGTFLLSLFHSPRTRPLYSPVSELLSDFPELLMAPLTSRLHNYKGIAPSRNSGTMHCLCPWWHHCGFTALLFKSPLWFQFHTYSLGLLFYIVFFPQATNLDLLRALHIPHRWRSYSWAGMNPSRGTDTFFGSQMPGSEKRSRIISWY